MLFPLDSQNYVEIRQTVFGTWMFEWRTFDKGRIDPTVIRPRPQRNSNARLLYRMRFSN